MTLRTSLVCSAVALAVSLSALPAAQAAESGEAMSKMSSGGMMKKDTMMKSHKKHKDSMMKSDGDAMKKDDAPPAQ